MDQADLGQAQDIHSSALRDAFIKKKKKKIGIMEQWFWS